MKQLNKTILYLNKERILVCSMSLLTTCICLLFSIEVLENELNHISHYFLIGYFGTLIFISRIYLPEYVFPEQYVDKDLTKEEADHFKSIIKHVKYSLITYSNAVRKMPTKEYLKFLNFYVINESKNPLFPYQEVTTIVQFEVINPRHELETKGEILTQSIYGEYCPEASLRGYSLESLLSAPNHYRPILIMDRGELKSIGVEKTIQK